MDNAIAPNAAAAITRFIVLRKVRRVDRLVNVFIVVFPKFGTVVLGVFPVLLDTVSLLGLSRELPLVYSCVSFEKGPRYGPHRVRKR